MVLYQPYAWQSHCDYRDHYAVRVGGCGGRIIASEMHLTLWQADRLCELLNSAYASAREER